MFHAVLTIFDALYAPSPPFATETFIAIPGRRSPCPYLTRPLTYIAPSCTVALSLALFLERVLRFSNKIYAPKWDDLMTLLEGIQSLSPASYQSMKTVIWGRINAKLKEDEKVHGLEEESSPGRPTNCIPFHDLAMNELACHKTRADRDKAEVDVAGTQQAGAGTLVDFTPLPPAGGDSQATSPTRQKRRSTSKLPPAQVQAATSTVEVANTLEGRVSRAGSVGVSSAASTAEGQGPEEE
ncbi:hypothetical protein C8Q72DRAFT_892265 [Fomitopsis betulina]|nr:hypothetical protein C8Q72DRAFT_892265 [Fomitopsis betulina]